MKNNKRVVFIDYDETLFDHNVNKVHEEVMKLLVDARKNDVDIFLSTGRPMLYLKYNSALINSLSGVICANGSLIIKEKMSVFSIVFEKTHIESLLNYSIKNKISILFYGKNNAYLNFYDIELANKLITNNKYSFIKIKDINTFNDEIYQACVFASNTIIDKMKQDLDFFEIYKWGSSGADIVLKNISKGNAINNIIKKYHYKFENTYGIGDGENDIPMFEAVYNSIAMGNAVENVKKHAKEVTNHITNNGLEQALEKIIYKK